jgi:hypothetical protein
MDYRLRLVVIAYSIVLLLWMSLEDVQVGPVAALGAGFSALVTLHLALRRLGGTALTARQLGLAAALGGGVTGAGASLCTALLMFFKNAWHAHTFPDFPPGLMLAILERAPAWGLAGMLIGIGLALGWMATR